MTTTGPRGWHWRGFAAVVARDLRVVRGSKPVMIRMLIVPALLLMVLPLATAIGARLGAAAIDLFDLQRLLALLPADIAERVADDPAAGVIEVSLVYRLSPILLLVPLTTASVIAADAIAGERERQTLEGLLLTPLTDRELFTAKLLGAWLPAVAVGIIGGAVYALVADLAAAGAVDGCCAPTWSGPRSCCGSARHWPPSASA